ncbi:BZ3500_MvSof-1268-A1-R1_Chr1-2g01306 [Microbotryum saponariae]|uniref:BZ3500_MvSof-1268-A1-R1_Chr1-2g01306 protein n=1 Tax=Microbotryum saponariae TaxID=289078 RepID=A0A2X0L6B1_9BASI|nr:BZ3500_MvSof-1268-A1-R1_Chr1-2g01306 [Microbotryum saponariae]SCZ97041.1 BZ3501_MvSof-1269-A2-R1_Chr1-2g00905 [Microbotryum saponariae]
MSEWLGTDFGEVGAARSIRRHGPDNLRLPCSVSQFNDASHSPKSQPCQVKVDCAKSARSRHRMVRYDIISSKWSTSLPRYPATLH